MNAMKITDFNQQQVVSPLSLLGIDHLGIILTFIDPEYFF